MSSVSSPVFQKQSHFVRVIEARQQPNARHVNQGRPIAVSGRYGATRRKGTEASFWQPPYDISAALERFPYAEEADGCCAQAGQQQGSGGRNAAVCNKGLTVAAFEGLDMDTDAEAA